MRSNTAILLTFAASASAAVDFMAIPHVRRELNILPRATAVNDAGQCASEALSIVKSMPTPPPQLVSDLAEHPQTDPCHFSIPQSLSAEYSSYEVEISSWFSGHKAELTSLASDCSILSSYTSLVNVCSTGGGSGSGSSGPNTAAADTSTGASAPTGSDSSSPSKTSGSDSSDSASKTAGSASKSTNAAVAHETGMAFAALAAAGIAAIL
ncbi:hypothetical protein V8C37DRAFT_364856 [Trichoderma ceciliae]